MLNIRWEDSHVAVHSFGRPATNVSMAAFAAAKSVGLLTITAKVNAPPFNRDIAGHGGHVAQTAGFHTDQPRFVSIVQTLSAVPTKPMTDIPSAAAAPIPQPDCAVALRAGCAPSVSNPP